MSAIAIVGVSSAGGVITGGGQSDVTVGGNAIAVVGDAVAPHGKGPHANATLVGGSSIATVNGTPICREGDMASCGHVITGGNAAINVD